MSEAANDEAAGVSPGADPAGIDGGIDEARISPVRRGHRLGRYLLCYELASGGMATVYLGRVKGLAGFEKLVAIKIIHPHLAKEQEFVDMFLDEARLAARISHPNACGVFDFGKEDGTYFLAMEYLVGESGNQLARALRKRPDLFERFDVPLLMAYIVQQSCEGLHAAHEVRGDDGGLLHVVHRDVTPHNLFVGYDGSVRVVDFGVAKAEGRSHHTTAGTLKSKHAYMSPEQIKQVEVDRRADVWALGVTLFELLTRKRLFRRDGEYETLKAVLEDKIPVPSQVRSGLSKAFDSVVHRALQRDPDDRYSSAREMGRDLARVMGKQGGVSTADLADLMEELFAEERARRSELLENARVMDPENQSSSKVVPAPGIRQERSVSESASISRMDGDTPEWGEEEEAPSRRWALALAAALAVGCAGLGGAWALGAFGSAPPLDTTAQTSAVTTPETTAAAEPPATDSDAEQGVADPVDPDVEDPPAAAEVPPPDSAEAAAEGPAEEPAAPSDEAPTDRPAEPAAGSSPPRDRTRSATRPARPAQPVGSGTLNIVTPPGWAETYADGQRIGRSPSEIRLPSGSHSLRIMPYGEGPPITRRVTVENGATARLVIRLPD